MRNVRKGKKAIINKYTECKGHIYGGSRKILVGETRNTKEQMNTVENVYYRSCKGLLRQFNSCVDEIPIIKSEEF